MSEALPKALDPFAARLETEGLMPLRRGALRTLQVNVGKLCNQACHHCHVEAGPKRKEIMDARTATRLLELLDKSPGIDCVDLTGGAPEMNPEFRRLVRHARARGKEVIVRSNLTILTEPGYEDMIAFFRSEGVRVIASLPCYTADNVDRQRGKGVFGQSIAALRALNAAGFGKAGSPLGLDLVYNPLGASLPGPQATLERDYKARLLADFGIEFHRLFTLTNMPIKRFAEQLQREGKAEAYQALLERSFDAANVPDVMCRSLVSVGYDGQIYDCDFHQMLEIPLKNRAPGKDLWAIESFDAFTGSEIATAEHCFGCTAGAGSSCTGALR